MNKPEYIIYHNTGSDNTGVSQLRAVNAYHKSREYPKSKLGYYVGYHYFIDVDGKWTQTRLHNEVGSHCKAQNMNFKSIGVCIAGNLSSKRPTEAQMKSMLELDLLISSEIKGIKRGAHRDFGNTECWGNLMKHPKEEIDAMKRPKKPSPWAVGAINKAKEEGVTHWDDPFENVGSMTLAWWFHKYGVLSSVYDGEKYVPIESATHGWVTKEQMAVIIPLLRNT